MRRVLLLVAVGACATACASAGNATNEESTAKQSTLFSGSDPTAAAIVGEKPRAATLTLSQPPAAVWLAVKKVYADWDIPLTVENPAAHQLGNSDFYKTHQFAGKSMTDFLSCGNGMTGPNAASFRIFMSLLSIVGPDGHGGSKLLVTFVATAQDMGGGATDRVQCNNNGRLEALFLDKVKANLGAS